MLNWINQECEGRVIYPLNTDRYIKQEINASTEKKNEIMNDFFSVFKDSAIFNRA